MAGEAKRMLDSIIQQRSKGQRTLIITTKTKLLIKGIDTDNFTEATEDVPEILDKIREIGREMGIQL